MDVKTRDPDVTTAFLTSVLGWAWSVDETDWRRATKARLGGHRLASVSDLASPVYPPGLPDHVAYYAAVDSVDAAVARATRHGAELLVEPFTAGDQGRVATLLDPLGAPFSLWQPTGGWTWDHGGLLGAPRRVVWAGPGPGDAEEFYRGALGLALRAGAFAASPRPPRPPGPPGPPGPEVARWIAVIAVHDASATAARAVAAGGDVAAWTPGPTDGLLVTSPTGIELAITA